MLRDDLASGYALSSALGDLLARLNADRSQADLLMDFRQIDAAGAKDVAATAAKAVNGLAGVAEWRSLIFAASNMPRSLREFPRDAVGSVPRVEFDVWRDIVGRGLKRTPSFGDYGVVHPDHIYADKTFNVSASIKYTLEDRWLIARGQSLFGDRGYAQYYGLARLLTKQKDFKGNDYNWANEEIENKAKRRGTTGNPTTWISVGTHRHVTFVASQVGETLADAS
jgi:hypothetical protein